MLMMVMVMVVVVVSSSIWMINLVEGTKPFSSTTSPLLFQPGRFSNTLLNLKKAHKFLLALWLLKARRQKTQCIINDDFDNLDLILLVRGNYAVAFSLSTVWTLDILIWTLGIWIWTFDIWIWTLDIWRCSWWKACSPLYLLFGKERRRAVIYFGKFSLLAASNHSLRLTREINNLFPRQRIHVSSVLVIFPLKIKSIGSSSLSQKQTFSKCLILGNLIILYDQAT